MTTPTRQWRARLQRAAELPIARFMGIGVISTLAYALLFLVLAGPLGSTAANALTFGVRGRDALLRHHLGGLAMFAISLAFTDGALALLHAGDAHPARGLELTVLLVASFCATATRYVGFSTLLFSSHPAAGRPRPVHSLPNQGR
jgi:hypothetical protein